MLIKRTWTRFDRKTFGLAMVDEDDFCSYGERNEDENGRT